MDLAAYAALVAPGRPEVLARLQDRVDRGELHLADIRLAPDRTAAVRIAALGPRSASLLGPYGADEPAADLIPSVLAHARTKGIEMLSSRPRARQLGPAYRAALLANGFRLLGERVEYKTPVDELPTDEGTPLHWRVVELDTAADVLRDAAQGDPHGHDEHAQPHAVLKELLADPVLTNGPECLQVGYENDDAVAFLCVQIRPETGWSRISYMGLVPGARGRGLGKWVHRHGFRMIREQGGTLYHGGTATTNTGMIRLFEMHGCREFERMFEFEWKG